MLTHFYQNCLIYENLKHNKKTTLSTSDFNTKYKIKKKCQNMAKADMNEENEGDFPNRFQ